MVSSESSPRPMPSAIVAAVRALYEAYPYPKYPLLAKPRWQDGYLTHSAFAGALVDGLTAGGPARPHRVRDSRHPRPVPPTILIGGGGEILPYVIRKWEPSAHQIISVDLSARSLRRARWRCLLHHHTRFARADLDAYLQAQPPQSFAHIDAYGVLHHMPNPSATLRHIASRLTISGTLRLMVYNAQARLWIRHLQRLFALLGVDRFAPKEVAAAKELLLLAAAESPALAERLRQLNSATLKNATHFADTFLHPRETRLNIEDWFAAIAGANLHVVGLLDRYGELDDLENPLWRVPSPADLSCRAADGRFEHNLELFISRADAGERLPPLPPALGPLWRFPYLFKAPPLAWFTYTETRSLSWPWRWRLWRAHLDWVMRRDRRAMPALLAALPTPAAARLARLGAILPGQIEDAGRRAALARPLSQTVAAPTSPAPLPLHGAKVHTSIYALLAAKGRDQPRYLQQAAARLYLAQR